jgi:HSP20 family protein
MNQSCTMPRQSRHAERFPSLFGDLFSTFMTPAFAASAPGAAMNPALDVVEGAEGYRVTLDLPGLTQEHVNVQFADNVLTIQGERREESARDEDRHHIVERTRGAFARSIKFPTNVDPSRVKAVMKHGVLTVTVPKTETARTQAIKVVEE